MSYYCSFESDKTSPCRWGLEEGCHFQGAPVFGLGEVAYQESKVEGGDDEKGNEGEILECPLKDGEDKGHDEVGHPVDEHSHGRGGPSRVLREQLPHAHPGDRP